MSEPRPVFRGAEVLPKPGVTLNATETTALGVAARVSLAEENPSFSAGKSPYLIG